MSDVRDITEEFVIPADEDYDQALQGKPVFITDNLENKTTVMTKLNSLVDTYLYISRNIDPEILRYLNETEEAVSFYYSVENSQTGIKVTFAIIYIIVVTLLLFLSTSIAITFAGRLTKPIINLISASQSISKGKLDTRVPDIESDEEIKILNKNFNSMIDRLKKQQEKLLDSERYSAWETVARKLAHEIKNPLTPIQLSIDSLRDKYANRLKDENNNFVNYLNTINRQIKDIEKMVNEFSDFARMPSPILKKIKLNSVIDRAVEFYKMAHKDLNLTFKKNPKENYSIKGDSEQLHRVFLNLIKNSIEAIEDKKQKDHNLQGKISVEIVRNNEYIVIKMLDNGSGFNDIKNITKPYYTTKKDGTGLGLPIVSKIINEHKGEIVFLKNPKGAEIEISLPTI